MPVHLSENVNVYTILCFCTFDAITFLAFTTYTFIDLPPGGGGGGIRNIYWWGCALAHHKRGVLGVGTAQKGGS